MASIQATRPMPVSETHKEKILTAALDQENGRGIAGSVTSEAGSLRAFRSQVDSP